LKILSPDGSLSEPLVDMSTPFFRLAFRPFFLLGAIFSMAALLLWAGLLSNHLAMPLYGGALWWHIHEMMFGFTAAIIVGFLLTAVQNWTRVPSIKGKKLAGLVALWLIARVFLLIPDWVPGPLIALVDIAFLPLAAIALAYPVVRARLWRNLIFVPLLLAMAAINTTMHWSVFSSSRIDLSGISTTMVMLVTLLIAIMGGRVIPMFTANGTGTAQIKSLRWLDRTALTSLALATVINLVPNVLPAALLSFLLWLAAASHLARALRWRFWVTAKVPLLWSLHLGYLCIPLGLSFLALAPTTTWISHSQAIHTLTVGAMGTIILSMISRVSLGHTGHQIAAGKLMTLALMLILCAFLARVFGIWLVDDKVGALVIAAVLWAIAYGCFVVYYFPLLTRPRADGQAG